MTVALILPDRHRRPLMVAPLIDWGNPLMRDLAFVYFSCDGQASGWACNGDHVRSYTNTSGVPTGVLAPSQIGFGLRANAYGIYGYATSGLAPLQKFMSNKYSLFTWGTCESASVTQNAIDDDNGNTTSRQRKFQFRVANGQVQFIPFDTTINNTPFGSPAFPPMSVAEMRRGFTMMGTANGDTNTARAYQNRLKQQFTVTNLASPNGDVWVGARKAGGASNWNTGVIRVVAGWGREVTEPEYLSLVVDPEQFARYPSRIILSMPDIAFTRRRALIMVGGQIQEVVDALVGTNQKPLVLYLGEVRQRVASEGVPLVLVNGTIRTLAANEQLVV